MKTHVLVLSLLVVLLFAAVGHADVLFGECSPRNGMRISTSWNGTVAYSRNGKYRLDLGGRVNAHVTIYVNGMFYARVKVDGTTRLDIDARQ